MLTESLSVQLLVVKEGENSVVEFTASRTAFTCFGLIKSASLDVKSGVTVLASGVSHNCSQVKEDGLLTKRWHFHHTGTSGVKTVELFHNIISAHFESAKAVVCSLTATIW